MDIQYIREFASIADNANLSDIADQYYISPSTLSRHIRELENEIGYPLFDRTARTMELNEQGRLFLSYAKMLLSTYDNYQSEAEKALYRKKHGLMIGYIGQAAQIAVEHIMYRFLVAHRDISLTFFSDLSSNLNAYFSEGGCDFVFGYCLENTKNNIRTIDLYEAPIAAIVPVHHALAAQKSIDYSDLKQETLVLQTAYDRAIFLKHMERFRQSGFHPNTGFVVDSEDAMMDIVGASGGIGFMVKEDALRLKTDKVAIVDIEPPVRIQFSVCFKAAAKMAQEQDAFLRFIKEEGYKYSPGYRF